MVGIRIILMKIKGGICTMDEKKLTVGNLKESVKEYLGKEVLLKVADLTIRSSVLDKLYELDLQLFSGEGVDFIGDIYLTDERVELILTTNFVGEPCVMWDNEPEVFRMFEEGEVDNSVVLNIQKEE